MIVNVQPPSMKEFKGLFLKFSREVYFMCMDINAQIYIAETKSKPGIKCVVKELN